MRYIANKCWLVLPSAKCCRCVLVGVRISTEAWPPPSSSQSSVWSQQQSAGQLRDNSPAPYPAHLVMQTQGQLRDNSPAAGTPCDANITQHHLLTRDPQLWELRPTSDTLNTNHNTFYYCVGSFSS